MPKAKMKTSKRRSGYMSSSSDSDDDRGRVRKRKGKNGVSDSEDEVSVVASVDGATYSESTQSQHSASHLERTFAQMSVQDREYLVNNIIRYLLVADRKKLPIRITDIKKNALKEHSRAFVALMKLAIDKLRNVFGIEMVEIELGKQKAYILINALDNKYDAPHQTWPPEDHAHVGLLMVILSVIFMKGNLIAEEELYDMLRRLGINIDHPDETFGDVKRLLMNDFVRQCYLEVEREPGTDPPVHRFRWGKRAKCETSKRHAMDFICQVFGEDTPDRWTAQMHDIDQSEAAEKKSPNGSSASAPSTSGLAIRTRGHQK